MSTPTSWIFSGIPEWNWIISPSNGKLATQILRHIFVVYVLLLIFGVKGTHQMVWNRVQNNESLNERNLTISPNSKVLVASTDQKYTDIWAIHSSLLPVLSPQVRVKLNVCDLLVIAISVVFSFNRLTLNVPKQILPSRLWVLLGVYSLGKRLHTCCVEHLESLKSPTSSNFIPNQK